MSTTNLQIPISEELRISAQRAADSMGFSSLQELVRIILNKISTKSIQINFVDEERLSPKAERRYLNMIKNIKTGKGWHEAKDVDDLMKQLDEK